jgi:hypothetical protein
MHKNLKFMLIKLHKLALFFKEKEHKYNLNNFLQESSSI